MLENILELIYPNVCGFCGKISKESLCKKCKILIKDYEIDIIKKAKKEDYYDEVLYIFKYKDIIRDTIIGYKFNNKPFIYKTFSKIILKNKKICGFLKKYDIIIPVPVSKKRKRERGYNQTELIAREIAKKTELELIKNILIKHKNIVPQSELNKEERKSNIKDAFRVLNLEIIKNKKILLFDDIYTTGSTVNECSKVLKESGANKIGILTIAKD